jgi:hypothetical protein
MLLTLLLSPQNVGLGLGEALARFFFGPFVLWFSYRWVRRGLRLVKSEWPEEKKTGWAFLTLAFVVVTEFYYATRPPYWPGHEDLHPSWWHTFASIFGL